METECPCCNKHLSIQVTNEYISGKTICNNCYSFLGIYWIEYFDEHTGYAYYDIESLVDNKDEYDKISYYFPNQNVLDNMK